MLKTHIEYLNGKPYISVDGELFSPMAYTTYFDECGEYSDFIKSGYKMFFVNVSFTDLPINNVTGFTPFRTGVFEKDIPDYSEFDGIVNEILQECPDALIFPRINIAMPRKWTQENIYETVETKTGIRESLHSDLFLRDGGKLLEELVLHIRSQEYAHRIAGYQLCGGTTQEWMHHDLAGSYSEMGLEKFRLWMREKYNEISVPSFSKDDFGNPASSEIISRFGEFCCESAAKTVEYFAKLLKNLVNNEQIAGVFYGYNAFVNEYLYGLHGLRFIIDSPYIDFFSSPCGYDECRSLGIDWGDMLPTGSLKEKGKLYFVECDVRTYLTRQMQASRPGRYPDGIYTLTDDNGNKTVWCGPETQELSVSAIQKTFAHQLTKGSGVWWFDMWGGWYHDEKIMSEMEKMKSVADLSVQKKSDAYPDAETVMFIDEKAYLNNPRGSAFFHCVNWMRSEMGNTGIPFEMCMVEDAEKVLPKYKAAIFAAPLPSAEGEKAMSLCEKMNVPYIKTTTEKTSYKKEELRTFLISSGVHCYNDAGNVVYCANGFLGVHAAQDGEIKISLPQKYNIKPLLGTDFSECETDEILIEMKKYDTVLFELI